MSYSLCVSQKLKRLCMVTYIKVSKNTRSVIQNREIVSCFCHKYSKVSSLPQYKFIILLFLKPEIQSRPCRVEIKVSSELCSLLEVLEESLPWIVTLPTSSFKASSGWWGLTSQHSDTDSSATNFHL